MNLKGAFVVCFTVFICRVWSQGGGPQYRGLFGLGRSGNSDFVDNMSCVVTATTTLNCSFVNTSNLTVDSSGTTLEMVEYRICLCDSAFRVDYTQSNGQVLSYSCSQCPTTVSAGPLTLYHDIDVYTNTSNNVTTIGVAVQLTLATGDDVNLFNHSIPLSEQDMAICKNGSKGPPDSCPDPTTPPPTTMTTPQIQPTTAAPLPKGNHTVRNTIIIVIVVFFVIVVGVLVFLALLYCSSWYQRQVKKLHNPSPPFEDEKVVNDLENTPLKSQQDK